MSEMLFIRLEETAEQPIQWLIWSAEVQEIIASGELAGAAQLVDIAEKANGRKVTILASTAAITLKKLVVPAKSDRALKAATPYALEDELAQDVDQLFFAYGKKPKQATGEENCFVAIVAHEQMRTWTEWLKQAGIASKVMLPDVLALPWQDDKQAAVAIGEQLLMRHGLWSGNVVELDWAPTYLTQRDKFAQQEQTLTLYSTLSLPELTQTTVELQPAELPLALLAQQAQEPIINLLQGSYKAKDKASPLVKGWLVAAGVAFVALTLNLVVKAVELYQNNQQLVQLDQQIVQTYMQAFPDTSRVRVSTVRSQLNGKLKLLNQTGETVSFLTMMQKMQPAFSRVQEVKPLSIRFDGGKNTIRMQASSNSYQSFEQFKLQLEQDAFEVTPGAQNNQGDQIVGSFTIRSKS